MLTFYKDENTDIANEAAYHDKAASTTSKPKVAVPTTYKSDVISVF